MQRDLATFDALRGPMLRLQQLVARAALDEAA